MVVDKFSSRHIGPRGNDINEMLSVCGASSLEQLIPGIDLNFLGKDVTTETWWPWLTKFSDSSLVLLAVPDISGK